MLTSSTLRFDCRPSAVSFDAAGLLAPMPLAVSRAGAIVKVLVR